MSETVIRLDVVPDDFIGCPDEDCGRSEALLLPDGSIVCAAPDCCVRRGTWIQP
jgi:hypothetical protein